MAYNPYGAPAAYAQSTNEPSPQGNGPQPWEAGEVIGRAWDVVKVHWVPLVFGTMIGGAAASAPQQIANFYNLAAHGPGRADYTDPVYDVLLGVGGLIGWVLQAFFQAGFTRMYLSGARGRAPEFAHVFSGGPRFWSMLGAMFLHFVMIVIGFALLIVPGVILSLGLMLYPYYVVDKGMGAVDALKASWEATMGQKGKLFVLGLYSFGVMIIGLLACCIGTMPALAVISVAQAIVYVRLTGTEGAGPPQPPQYAQYQQPYAAPPPPPPYNPYAPR
jgi:hypothetical protein